MTCSIKPPNGITTPREAAFRLERALSGCRHAAAAQGFSFLTYLIGMAVEEARERTRPDVSLPTPLSDQETYRYIARTVVELQPLVLRPRLRTLAFMLDHVRSEAELSAESGCEPG